MAPRKSTVMRVVPASQAKNNFGEMIRRVYEDDECQIIERAGLPVAALVSISDLERLYPEKAKSLPRINVSAKRHRSSQKLMRFLNETRAAGEPFSEAEVEADVAKAVEAVRYGRRKK